tara:strand:- start:53 stop:487 length:435 start_codon:yes stop_codon:yes gene_type:complete
MAITKNNTRMLDGSIDITTQVTGYQEGTWTAGSVVGTINPQNVSYTKVGRLVHFHLKGAFSDSSTNASIEITGLPFEPSVNQVAGQAMWRYAATNHGGGVALVTTTSKIIFYSDKVATDFIPLKHNEIGSASEVIVSGTYITSS